jgi:hypothetical protein
MLKTCTCSGQVSADAGDPNIRENLENNPGSEDFFSSTSKPGFQASAPGRPRGRGAEAGQVEAMVAEAFSSPRATGGAIVTSFSLATPVKPQVSEPRRSGSMQPATAGSAISGRSASNPQSFIVTVVCDLVSTGPAVASASMTFNTAIPVLQSM